MAALFQAHEVAVRKTGKIASVPDNPMYFLDCIDDVLKHSESFSSISRLTDYQRYGTLDEDDIIILAEFCLKIGPDQLEGKCIFNEPELCGNYKNEFYELETVNQRMFISERILVGGKQTKVCKIMAYKNVWIMENYHDPLRKLKEQRERKVQRAHDTEDNCIIL